ncbi:MAG: mercury transporter [Eubacteriaceae bacterium]
MEFLTDLKSLRTGVLILINAGLIVRVIVCFIQASGNMDEKPVYMKRAKNAVIFAAIANCLVSLKELFGSYFV